MDIPELLCKLIKLNIKVINIGKKLYKESIKVCIYKMNEDIKL